MPTSGQFSGMSGINGLISVNKARRRQLATINDMEPKMAKNPYIKQHADFCAWIDRERDTMPPDLLTAADRFRCALWVASKSHEPLDGFNSELAAFQTVAQRSCGHRH